MFTLTISCLTASHLIWFVYLTFQISMQYCSLQHQALFLPPDRSITDHHFCFGTTSSFFLELLVIILYSSPVACLPLSGLGEGAVIIWCHIFFTFSYCPWGSPGENTGVDCHFLLQWTTGILEPSSCGSQGIIICS